MLLIPRPGTGVKGAVLRGGAGVVLLALAHFHQKLETLSHSGLLIAKHRQSNSTQDKTKRAARQRIWDPLV